jgi:hypothetical protein
MNKTMFLIGSKLYSCGLCWPFVQYNMSRRSMSNKTDEFSPNIIRDTVHHLSSEQLSLLRRGRGPAYVSPCQLHLSSSFTLDEIVSKQLASTTTGIIFSKNSVGLAGRIKFEDAITKYFHRLSLTPLPETIHERALHEQQVVRLIRRQLKNDNLVPRRTDDQYNVFYLGRAIDFDEKAKEYMNRSSSYQTIVGTVKQQQLDDNIDQIDSILKNLHQNKQITKDQLSIMRIKKVRC